MSLLSVDYYKIEALLTSEELLVRDTVREWVSERLSPIIDRCWQEGAFPLHLLGEMAELGILGPAVPAEYGGVGVGSVACGLIMQELERCDAGIRSFASVQSSLCAFPILAYGSEEQRRRWLPAMARGEVIGCFGLTEPEGGADLAGSMRTRAVPDGSGFVISGTKMWVTCGTLSQLALVWARVQENGRDTVRGFLVEKATPGLSTSEVRDRHGLRASDMSKLVLDQVHVPASSMLPGASGMSGPLSCLTEARHGIAWGAVGAAMACYDEALAFIRERMTSGAPIGGRQLVQQKLVQMLTGITQCQLLCWRLGRLKEEGQARPPQVSLARRACVQTARQVAGQARDILGAAGVTCELSAMRHMCNLESVCSCEGTPDALIVGEEITGPRAL